MRPSTRLTLAVLLTSLLVIAIAYKLTHTNQRPAPQRPPLASAPLSTQTLSLGPNTFTVVTIDPRRADLHLFWKRPDGTRFATFDALARHLAADGRRLLFATNAGIFDPTFTPCGLHVEAGRELVPLNGADGAGNFYLKPNGVFLIDAAGPRVLDARDYPGTTPDTRLATQSGPLLVSGGQLHPRLNPQSPNRRLRSGVGVSPDGLIHFALSHGPVTFHELATLFRDHLDCPDALYLDGVISRFHPPTSGDAPKDAPPNFAGILAVTAPQ